MEEKVEPVGLPIQITSHINSVYANLVSAGPYKVLDKSKHTLAATSQYQS